MQYINTILVIPPAPYYPASLNGGRMNSVYKFSAGRFICKPIRAILEQQIVTGKQIEFAESAGIMTRNFVIKGCAEDIKYITQSLKSWAQDNDYKK